MKPDAEQVDWSAGYIEDAGFDFDTPGGVEAVVVVAGVAGYIGYSCSDIDSLAQS